MASSTSYKNLKTRLKDIDQILEAHTAITKFENAKRATESTEQDLKNVSNIINALVSDPGRGRPKEVDALNRSGFVLLCSHFQGFVEDLHDECARIVLDGKVQNVDNTIKLIKPRHSNPHSEVINQMFAGLGIYDLMEKIRWQKCSNETVKRKLKEYIQMRNKIAHGTKLQVTKPKLENFKNYVWKLAEELDKQVKKEIKEITNNNPW